VTRFPPEQPFAGFGPGRFRPADLTGGTGCVRAERISKLKSGTLAEAPELPGVYAMLDPLGRVIYVGKAKSLRHRLMSYFRTRSRDRKAGRILKRARAIAWEVQTDEFAALLRELELIQRHRPRFNVVGQPGRKQYVYIVVGRDKSAGLVLSRKPQADAKAVFGPFIARARAERAVQRLNDRYKLRTCPATTPMTFRGKATKELALTPLCLRFELGTCAGPCAAMCGERQYAKHLAAAVAFLVGSDRSFLDEVKAEMATAAEAMHYERAAAARDKLADLTWLDERLAQLQKARQRKRYLYPLLAHDGRTTWYRIDRGQVQAVAFGPPDAPPDALTGPLEPRLIVSGRDVDSVLLVAAWFRKHRPERDALRELDVRS
jgi:excinuclease ABC subunit C